MSRARGWIGVLFAAMLLATGCALLPHNAEPPRVSLVGLDLVSADLFEQRYQVRLRLKNPNSFALPVQGMDFRLDINGDAFADGVSNQTVTVPPFGETVLELEVSSSLVQVLQQLQSLQGRTPAGLDYRVRGSLALGGSARRLPFDHSGELALPGGEQPPPRQGL